MHNGVPAIIVLPIMIAIFFIVQFARSQAVLLGTLVFILLGLLYVGISSASGGDYGPLLGLGAFFGAGAVTYLFTRATRRKK